MVKNCTYGIESIKLLHNDNYISVVSMKVIYISEEIGAEGLWLSEIENNCLEDLARIFKR